MLYGPTKDAAPSEIATRRRSVATIPAHKTFLREGEIASQIHMIYAGWAFRFKQLSDGRRQILSFLIPGDAAIMESLCVPGLPLPFSVKALTPISVCTFAVQDMIAITQSSEAQIRRLAAVMHDYLASQNSRLLDIGRRSALGRVSQLILKLESRLRARKLSNNGSFLFPARQEHIADALGLTTVYVNRTLDRLRRDGIIDFDRKSMTVRDVESLKKLAEEE